MYAARGLLSSSSGSPSAGSPEQSRSPLPFHLSPRRSTSRPSTAATTAEGWPPRMARSRQMARNLVRQMSGHSLRRKGARDAATSEDVQGFTNRAGAISRPVRPPSQSLLSTMPAVRDLPEGFFETLSMNRPHPSAAESSLSMERSASADPANIRLPPSMRSQNQFRSLRDLQNASSVADGGEPPFHSLSPGPRSRRATLTKSTKVESAEDSASSRDSPTVMMQNTTKWFAPPADKTSDSSKATQDDQAVSASPKVRAESLQEMAIAYLANTPVQGTGNPAEHRHTLQLLEGRPWTFCEPSESSEETSKRSTIRGGDMKQAASSRTSSSPAEQSQRMSQGIGVLESNKANGITFIARQVDQTRSVEAPASDAGHSDGELSTQSHTSTSTRARRPRKPPSIRSTGTPSIVDVDEDDLKKLMDPRGFAREKFERPALTKEERL